LSWEIDENADAKKLFENRSGWRFIGSANGPNVALSLVRCGSFYFRALASTSAW